MSGNNWTAGPWVARPQTPMGAAICRVGPIEIGTNSEIGSDDADANLIAAAPDLYEALAEIVNDGGKFVMTHEAHCKARAALAKARGEK